MATITVSDTRACMRDFVAEDEASTERKRRWSHSPASHIYVKHTFEIPVHGLQLAFHPLIPKDYGAAICYAVRVDLDRIDLEEAKCRLSDIYPIYWWQEGDALLFSVEVFPRKAATPSSYSPFLSDEKNGIYEPDGTLRAFCLEDISGPRADRYMIGHTDSALCSYHHRNVGGYINDIAPMQVRLNDDEALRLTLPDPHPLPLTGAYEEGYGSRHGTARSRFAPDLAHMLHCKAVDQSSGSRIHLWDEELRKVRAHILGAFCPRVLFSVKGIWHVIDGGQFTDVLTMRLGTDRLAHCEATDDLPGPDSDLRSLCVLPHQNPQEPGECISINTDQEVKALRDIAARSVGTARPAKRKASQDTKSRITLTEEVFWEVSAENMLSPMQHGDTTPLPSLMVLGLTASGTFIPFRSEIEDLRGHGHISYKPVWDYQDPAWLGREGRVLIHMDETHFRFFVALPVRLLTHAQWLHGGRKKPHAFHCFTHSVPRKGLPASATIPFRGLGAVMTRVVNSVPGLTIALENLRNTIIGTIKENGLIENGLDWSLLKPNHLPRGHAVVSAGAGRRAVCTYLRESGHMDAETRLKQIEAQSWVVDGPYIFGPVPRITGYRDHPVILPRLIDKVRDYVASLGDNLLVASASDLTGRCNRVQFRACLLDDEADADQDDDSAEALVPLPRMTRALEL